MANVTEDAKESEVASPVAGMPPTCEWWCRTRIGDLPPLGRAWRGGVYNYCSKACREAGKPLHPRPPADPTGTPKCDLLATAVRLLAVATDGGMTDYTEAPNGPVCGFCGYEAVDCQSDAERDADYAGPRPCPGIEARTFLARPDVAAINGGAK